jgi:hypothetical protein
VAVTAPHSSEQIVIDFSGTAAHSWRVVTDGVMGGLSEGRLFGTPDGIAYQAAFGTAEQGWEVVKLPFASFVPSYRGRRVEEAPPLDPSQVRQLGFMIADRQEGEFRLEIEWVRAYGN